MARGQFKGGKGVAYMIRKVKTYRQMLKQNGEIDPASAENARRRSWVSLELVVAASMRYFM